MNAQEFRRTAVQTSIFSTITFGVEYSFQLVDIYWVAQIGVGAPTAITIISSIFFLLFAANEIIGASSSALLAQAFGKGDRDKAGFAIMQTLMFKLALGIMTAALFWLCIRLVARLYALNAQEITYMYDYASIIWVSTILLPVYASLMTALRAMKYAHLTAIFGIVALLLNMAINPVLIFGYGSIPALGIQGAAWATIIAQLCAMSLCLLALLRNKYGIVIFSRKHLMWSPKLYKKLILIGMPYAGIMYLYNIEGVLLPALIAEFDPEISDGYGIGSRIMGLLFMMIFGLSTGVNVAVGHALGSKQIDLIKQQLPIVFLYMISFIGVISGILFIFAEPIVLAFVDLPETVAVAYTYLRYMAAFSIGIGVMYMLSSVFEGAGVNIPPLITALVMYLAFEFPIIAFFWLTGLPALETLWLVLVATSGIGALMMYVFYRRGSWQYGRFVD